MSSPLFTSVVSRQDAAAQEVTTFSRGLSTEGEPGSSFVCEANKQQQNTPRQSKYRPTQSLRLGLMASRGPPTRSQAKTAASLGRPRRRKLLLPQRARASRAEQVTSPLCDVMTARLARKGGREERRGGPSDPEAFAALHSHVHGGVLTPATGTC